VWTVEVLVGVALTAVLIYAVLAPQARGRRLSVS
jgi:hypothetical protein